MFITVNAYNIDSANKDNMKVCINVDHITHITEINYGNRLATKIFVANDKNSVIFVKESYNDILSVIRTETDIIKVGE